MSGTVMPPTPAIQTATTLLDEAVGRLTKALTDCWPTGEYEADAESFNLLILIIRHVESVITLALQDLVVFPSAMVVARAAYEATIKLLWMMTPVDPFQREVRWLAHLQSEEDYYTKLASQLRKFGGGVGEQKKAQEIRQFRLAVMAKLPEGCTPLKQLPNLYQMLESLGEEHKYLFYIIGSQFTHGTHHATGIYRKNLGIYKILDEHITPKDWGLCFAMSWYSLRASGERYLTRTGGNTADFLSIEFKRRMQAAIDAVNGS